MTANGAHSRGIERIDGISMVSISIDEKRGSRSMLRQYAERFEADTTKWSFLRGTRDEVFDLANAFKLGCRSDLPQVVLNIVEPLVINRDGKVSTM